MEERSKSMLLIRHLPQELERQDVIEMICHFGAERVRPMGTQGPMKNSAFAQFKSEDAAEKCLRRLHQLEVLGHRLKVEYAKHDQSKHFPTGLNDEVPKTETKVKETDKVKIDINSEVNVDDKKQSKDEVFSKHGINFPRKPSLYYVYPPPTVSTLTNIANALASHPKFYTQVLHLMNKLNLPCPFGVVTPSPPMALDANMSGKGKQESSSRNFEEQEEIEDVEMEGQSTEESEIESDHENAKSRQIGSGVKVRGQKRPRKRMRLVQPDMSMMIKPTIVAQPSEVFESVETPKAGPITFHLSENVLDSSSKTVIKSKGPGAAADDDQSDPVTVVEGGFGKVEPPRKTSVVEEPDKPDNNYKINSDSFMSRSSIGHSRLKSDQMKEFSVFKNYKPGEPTSRLYIKNLTKQSTEQDLVNLFGVFVDWSSEMATNLFDIRLMKEGRMKGQAFVTLPDEQCAQKIVKECNGYVLHGKPVVIQFARSAKAKQVDVPKQDED